jgi:hypothetical protein
VTTTSASSSAAVSLMVAIDPTRYRCLPWYISGTNQAI